jgi:methylmalonyl-CoA decarboxylase subunit alpha
VDTVGLASDPAAEAQGVLRRAVRALQAMHRASVPVLTLHLGRCQGLSGMATAAPNRLLMRFAWPTAKLTDEDAPAGSGGGGGLWPTVEAFGIEEVIDPGQTREVLVSWLNLRCHALRPGRKNGPQFRP